ncbi:hypothetical protein [Gracilimonas sp. BCB1]|uniref:hypothetical protein n=1 Tax=Gracilimonas sp. BCB1 TaxID=3152362 RepID=UPI0032D92977
MRKVNTVLILVIMGMMTAACTTSVTRSTTTHVKDLVQSDVFGVLPAYDKEIIVYYSADEVEGEYIELATVQIQETAGESSTENMIEMLKMEAKELGGNGVILIDNKADETSGSVTKKVKAIAVYALDIIPSEINPLVLL